MLEMITAVNRMFLRIRDIVHCDVFVVQISSGHCCRPVVSAPERSFLLLPKKRRAIRERTELQRMRQSRGMRDRTWVWRA
jgi:hypothetical protein